MERCDLQSSEAEIVKEITHRFGVKGEIRKSRRVWVEVGRERLMSLLNFIKDSGFEHLSAISATDWLEEGRCELAYHLWSYADKVLLTVKTKIDREGPAIASVTPIWGESAQIHERELHELFGIEFEGNPDLKPLFLEDWEGPPPFRKDFDWREYVRDSFYDMENKREKGYWEVVPQVLYKQREPVPELSVEERIDNFREVLLPYSEEAAKREASRCLQCDDPALCVEACPAQVNVKEYVLATREGRYRDALETILERLPFPATCGRVCPHPCEEACNREDLEQPISIRAIKRFVADRFMDADWYPEIRERREERIAVVGSGPAGLTVASRLALKGFNVTIFDSGPFGGMLTQSIPDYRLPPEVPLKEIEEIKKLGVEMKRGTLGEEITIDSLFKEGYAAIFLGIGAHKTGWMAIPGEELEGVYSAVHLLKDIKLGGEAPSFKGKRVIVVGGGEVAIDAARTARRLGGEVTIVYRRAWEQMPAAEEGIRGAQEEGVEFLLLVNPVEIRGEGKVERISCIRMELGPPDETGRRRPIPIEGSEFELPADIFIEAIGESPQSEALESMGLKLGRRGLIETDDEMRTNLEGVFAAGDAVTGAATVIEAVAEGLRAAESMVEYCEQRSKVHA